VDPIEAGSSHRDAWQHAHELRAASRAAMTVPRRCASWRSSCARNRASSWRACALRHIADAEAWSTTARICRARS